MPLWNGVAISQASAPNISPGVIEMIDARPFRQSKVSDQFNPDWDPEVTPKLIGP